MDMTQLCPLRYCKRTKVSHLDTVTIVNNFFSPAPPACFPMTFVFSEHIFPTIFIVHP